MTVNDKEQEKQKPIYGGDVYCLKFKDKESSIPFIHLNRKFFSLSLPPLSLSRCRDGHSNCPQCFSSFIVPTKQFVILFYNTSPICFFFLNKSMNSESIRLRQKINEKTADIAKFHEIFFFTILY
jgi:hypothetical protein